MSENKRHRIGLQSKLKSMGYYVSRGYYIFDETNQGPIDFIAINMEGDVKFVECKAISKRSDGTKINRVLTDKQKKLNNKFKLKGYPPIEIMYSDVKELGNEKQQS